MKIVFTGNMGCGKSTAVACTMRLMAGYVLFDFDAVVRGLYTNPQVQQQLVQVFGTCDKSVISGVVHADPTKMAMLRLVMDPIIIQKMRAYDNIRDVVYDIPLFFEFNQQLALVPDVIICVSTDPSSQIQRIQSRNGLSVECINQILSNQLPQATKEELSHHTIRNNGTVADLEQAVASTLALAGVMP